MKRNHNHNNSHVTDGTVGGKKLHPNSANLHRKNPVNRTRNTCEKFKPGYNGSTNGGSGSHNINGENTMNANTDVKFDALNTKIDCNENVMNAKLSGQKSYMEGRFEAVLGEIKASRAESKAQFQAIQAQFHGIQAQFQGVQTQFQGIQTQFQAVFTKIEASEYRTKLWVIFTGAAVVVGSVGFVAASIAIWKAFSGS